MSVFMIILIHQMIFQSMFLAKNIILKKKLKASIQGKNSEAIIASTFFAVTIIASLIIAYIEYSLLDINIFMLIGLILLIPTLIISAMSLIDLQDSWRVGIIEDDNTELITTGIYKYSRNPYFLSYLLMFVSYTIILESIILLICTIISYYLIHKMILKEELTLELIHGDKYSQYKVSVSRYI